MNRKLHNSMLALMSSSALLLVAMLAGSPGTLPADRESTTGDSVVLATTSAAVATATTTATTPVVSQHSQRGQNRRTFQSVRMPFFSFFLPKE